VEFNGNNITKYCSFLRQYTFCLFCSKHTRLVFWASSSWVHKISLIIHWYTIAWSYFNSTRVHEIRDCTR